MSINSYIDSLTRVDKTKSIGNVSWSRVVQEKVKPKPCSFRGKGELPYQFELEQTGQSNSRQRDQKYFKEKKANSYETYYDNKTNYGKNRFADIIPNVREIGGGYNTFSNQAIERRFKENQSKYSSTEESDLSSAYATATSKSVEDSYNTVADTLDSLKLSSDESKNEVSSSENERYKMNAPMARFFHTQNNESSDIDTSTDMSSDVYNTSLDRENEEEIWDHDESDEQMYKGRIIRFFQSAEDEDVYVHPLKEQIQKDPEWQKYKLKRKGIEFIQTPRQFYLNLNDDDFNFCSA